MIMYILCISVITVKQQIRITFEKITTLKLLLQMR